MLYVFLEGPDDERFFSKVMAALLGECHYVLYANMPNSKVNNYIKSIDQTPTSDYNFLGRWRWEKHRRSEILYHVKVHKAIN